MSERWIYQKRDGSVEVREYISGDHYLDFSSSQTIEVFSNLYEDQDPNSDWLHCWKCGDSTMKQWGKRISLEDACKLIPDYQKKYEAGVACFESHKKVQQQKNQQSDREVNDWIRLRVLENLSDEQLLGELAKRLAAKTHSDSTE